MSSSDLEQQLTEAFQLEKDRKNPKLAETTFTIFLGNYDFSSIEAKKKLQFQLPFVYNSRGLMRYLQVDFHGAVDDYSKAIALNPKVAGFFYNRGLVRYRLKEFATAARDLNDALEIDPNHESAKLCLESMRQIPAD